MSSKMTNLLLAAYLFSSVLLLSQICQGQQCPPIYMRFSRQHSYCKPKNGSCPIYHSSVKPAEMKQILDLHNMYRNLVATGGERRAGGLPQAADMMQMVWDWELTAVAQRRAEHCIYEHDCNDCRRVENFQVGQNIAYIERVCPTGMKCPLNHVPDWVKVIKLFYDEVATFNKRYLNSVKFPPRTEFGHFTQMVWSKTWRIGCGYVAYKKGNGYRQFYVCNYGPGGNILNTLVYQSGPACSGCPTNSCCGKTCNRADYAGLCRMNKNDEAPIYRSTENFIFYCDFRSTSRDCSNSVTGSNKWRFVNALGGTYEEVVLNGGETTTLKFKKAIRSKQGLCLTVTYRFGPAIDGKKTSGRASIIIESQNSRANMLNLPTPSNKEFFSFNINLGWSYDTWVSFIFSVPVGQPSQFFNIQLITAKQGKC